jgi:hypothetical protein
VLDYVNQQGSFFVVLKIENTEIAVDGRRDRDGRDMSCFKMTETCPVHSKTFSIHCRCSSHSSSKAVLQNTIHSVLGKINYINCKLLKIEGYYFKSFIYFILLRALNR